MAGMFTGRGRLRLLMISERVPTLYNNTRNSLGKDLTEVTVVQFG
jgi:hypothetical protein